VVPVGFRWWHRCNSPIRARCEVVATVLVIVVDRDGLVESYTLDDLCIDHSIITLVARRKPINLHKKKKQCGKIFPRYE